MAPDREKDRPTTEFARPFRKGLAAMQNFSPNRRCPVTDGRASATRTRLRVGPSRVDNGGKPESRENIGASGSPKWVGRKATAV
jgi:hypothetical protein